MNWAEIARRKNAAAFRQAQRRMPAVSVPVADSEWTAPGYVHVGHFYSCVPDACYPWDPTVLRAIREHIDPYAMPIVIRSVWRYSNYHELGRIDGAMTLVRHGLARAVPDLGRTERQNFFCEMPSTPVTGLKIPGLPWSACRPNQIWDNWYDKTDRPWGMDLPGAYLPFDWDYFYALKRGEDMRVRMIRESQRREDENGDVIAAGAATSSVDEVRVDREKKKASAVDDRTYINRDLDAFYSIEPSDVEWKEQIASGGSV
jgi:hypothetical protein